jgi:hypothetical protein
MPRTAWQGAPRSTAIVLLLLASNVPPRRWPISRNPLMRSYPMVTVWAHHPDTSYFSRTCAVISRWVMPEALARSSARTHRSHVQPVFALTASSLIPARRAYWSGDGAFFFLRRLDRAEV